MLPDKWYIRKEACILDFGRGRSNFAGLIAALPLSIAIIGNFAVMGFLGITRNIPP
jgi:hypothetical protein